MSVSLPLDPDHPLSKFNDPRTRQIFAGIYNNILLTSGEKPPQSLLVCAAKPQEGATTVALGLALAAVEQQGQPVLLIDGNFHTPAICGAFGLPESSGLGDLLSGRLNLSDAISQTMVANLLVMGAGVAQQGHVRNLEPPNLRNLLNKLAPDYSLVIVDGPAVNAHLESALYASQVDRTFLVVHSGVTRVPVVKMALAKLSLGKAGQVDLILNRRVFNIPAWLYNRL
jgi:capsular exopolysaccharide synthesis family protein